MYRHLTKEEKKAYERKRRANVTQEARNYRLINKWLMRRYPDILTQYYAFRNVLQRNNPYRKDLTTAPQFRKFMIGEDGTVII